MKKILVSAYGCEPFRGSEAGVGWNWILQMARFYELFVIARENDRERIEQNLPEEFRSNLHFYYYDTCKLLMKVKKKDKGLYLYYWMWQIGIIPLISQLIKQFKPDYTMHLTFGSVWMPTFLPFFRTPFIWGPVGGGDGVPKQMLKILPLKQRIVQGLRYGLIATSWLNPIVAIPSKKSSLILCRTENNCEAIPKKYRNKCQVILETAMGDEVFANCKDLNCQRNHVIEIMTTGRLVPFKNTMMAVEGVHTLSTKYSNIHMTIIGKGPEKHRILEYIQNNKLETIVEIIPEIPREQLLMRLCDADIYAFPSLREGGSWALMEAMAVGLPVVCLNWTGMRIITDTESAIRIEPSDYENTKSEFTEGIEKLLLDSDLRCSIGTAARDRMMQVFNWTHVGDTIKEIFDQLEEK